MNMKIKKNRMAEKVIWKMIVMKIVTEKKSSIFCLRTIKACKMPFSAWYATVHQYGPKSVNSVLSFFVLTAVSSCRRVLEKIVMILTMMKQLSNISVHHVEIKMVYLTKCSKILEI